MGDVCNQAQNNGHGGRVCNQVPINCCGGRVDDYEHAMDINAELRIQQDIDNELRAC